MGVVEAEAKKKRRNRNIQQALLATVALTGVVLVAAMAPNASALFAKLPSIKRAQLRYRCKTALGRLAAQGLIAFEKRGGKQYARITDKGSKALAFEQRKGEIAQSQEAEME